MIALPRPHAASRVHRTRDPLGQIDRSRYVHGMKCPSKVRYQELRTVVMCDQEEGHDGDHHGFAFPDDRAQGEKTWANDEAIDDGMA